MNPEMRRDLRRLALLAIIMIVGMVGGGIRFHHSDIGLGVLGGLFCVLPFAMGLSLYWYVKTPPRER